MLQLFHRDPANSWFIMSDKCLSLSWKNKNKNKNKKGGVLERDTVREYR